MNTEFFRNIESQSNHPSNQKDSAIQINAFKKELSEKILEVDIKKRYFGFATNYERKVFICRDYFNHLWESVPDVRKSNDFKGFICYNIARAVEEIDPNISSYDFFVSLYQNVHEE